MLLPEIQKNSWRFLGLAAFIGLLVGVGIFVFSSLLKPPRVDHAWLPMTFEKAVREGAPAVVNIQLDEGYTPHAPPKAIFTNLQGEYGDDETTHTYGLGNIIGSGVIIDTEGYIVTNYHVVEDEAFIKVRLADGTSYQATLVGSDPETDLAVLKVNASGLPVVRLGDDRRLRVGDIVLAVGNPFGMRQTVTQGIVSAVALKNLGINRFESFIQTDAAINPGNSGGALLNVNGELVGINSSTMTTQGGATLGIGFSIPVSLVREVVADIKQYGQVKRGSLGVELSYLNDEQKYKHQLPHGVEITGMTADSAAYNGGLKLGDFLTHIDGYELFTPWQTRNILVSKKPGEKVRIKGIRDGSPFVLDVAVQLRPVDYISAEDIGHMNMEEPLDTFPPAEEQATQGTGTTTSQTASEATPEE